MDLRNVGNLPQHYTTSQLEDGGSMDPRNVGTENLLRLILQGDSKLLSVFPWPIIFKPERTK
jgi:hypothetical protein